MQSEANVENNFYFQLNKYRELVKFSIFVGDKMLGFYTFIIKTQKSFVFHAV